MDERLTQIIPAQPGYRLVIIDHYQHTPSWSMTPVTAWGLVRDDEHDIENRPGHWEGVVALWPHDDPNFPALTWEREDSHDTNVWIMLGPNDPDPPEAEITEEWQRRHEHWQEELQRKNPAAALAHQRDLRDTYNRLVAETEARIRKLERETGQDT